MYIMIDSVVAVDTNKEVEKRSDCTHEHSNEKTAESIEAASGDGQSETCNETQNSNGQVPVPLYSTVGAIVGDSIGKPTTTYCYDKPNPRAKLDPKEKGNNESQSSQEISRV